MLSFILWYPKILKRCSTLSRDKGSSLIKDTVSKSSQSLQAWMRLVLFFIYFKFCKSKHNRTYIHWVTFSTFGITNIQNVIVECVCIWWNIKWHSTETGRSSPLFWQGGLSGSTVIWGEVEGEGMFVKVLYNWMPQMKCTIVKLILLRKESLSYLYCSIFLYKVRENAESIFYNPWMEQLIPSPCPKSASRVGNQYFGIQQRSVITALTHLWLTLIPSCFCCGASLPEDLVI